MRQKNLYLLICDSDNWYFSNHDMMIISSPESTDGGYDQYTGIIILCEVNVNKVGNPVKRSALKGIEIAIDARLTGFRGPILFTSFLSRKQVYANKPEREIINAIGHDFIRLPVKPEEFIERLDNIESLDDLELLDIQNSYCRKEGIIRELAHRLSNLKYFDLVNKSKEELKQALIEAIQKIAGLYNENSIDFIHNFEIKYQELTEKNISEAVAEIGRYGERLIGEYSPISDDIIVKTSENNRKWKLLWVDDEADISHKLISYFNKAGVEVILCSSASQALDILENDWLSENRIGVVIADYRLCETVEGMKVHQPVQGYTLIKKIAESGRMIRLAALSALPRKFLLHSFKHFNVRTEVFSKRDYLEDDNTLKLLCDELIEMGDENEEAILSTPDDASGWKFLEQTYQQYRNWPDYSSIERKVSEKASFFVEYFNQHQEFPDVIPFPKSNYTKNKNPQKNIQKFQYYWLGRRLALWVGCIKKYPNDMIAEFLKGEPCSDYKQVISQYLGLRMDDYPFGLTVEEKNWFHYEMGIPIFRSINISKHLLTQIENEFKNFIGLYPVFEQQLRANDYRVNFDYSNNRATIYFTEQGKPLLKTFFYVKALYRILQIHLDIKDKDCLTFARKINFLLLREMTELRDNEISRSLLLLAGFFNREVRKLRKDPVQRLKPYEIDLVKEYFNAIKEGKEHRPKDQHKIELYTKTYIAYHNLAEKATVLNAITLEDVMEEIILQKIEDKQSRRESIRLTKNNITKDDEERLNFYFEVDDF